MNLPPALHLPPGYRLRCYDSIDSTNAEALRLASLGEPGGLWLLAGEQRGGRGRAGRNWVSPPGNLYASLLLRPACSAAAAPQLSLLTALAAHEAIRAASSDRLRPPILALKWPNDILLNGCKAGGILLESSGAARQPGFAVAIGIGLNVVHHPIDLARATAHLANATPSLDVPGLFQQLASTMAKWLGIWAEGANFGAVREAWQAASIRIGAPISVNINGAAIEGVFLGIDSTGALRLGSPAQDSPEMRITAGDVFV